MKSEEVSKCYFHPFGKTPLTQRHRLPTPGSEGTSLWNIFNGNLAKYGYK